MIKLKNKIIILVFINSFFCQGEYQILTTPKNAFQLSTNGGLSSLVSTYNYSNPATFNITSNEYIFNLIHYPSDIMVYNFSKNRYSISFLDYGFFEDQIQDIIYQSFSAYEVMIQYNYTKKVRNHTFGFSVGLFQSNIYNYNSLGMSNSIGMNSFYKELNLSLGFSVENLGYILKSYTAYNQKLPLKYRLGINTEIKKLVIGYDILYLKYTNELQHIICLQFMPNENMTIRLSNTSNYKDLWLEDNPYNFISGLGIGLDISLKNIEINIGLLNLGIAGTVYGTSINFLRN